MGKNNLLNLVLLYGGKSGEHEVSQVSASYILNNLHPEKYQVYPVWIDHQGRWFYLPLEEARGESAEGPLPPGLYPCNLARGNESIRLRFPGKNSIPVDFVFPMLHGSFGEDGRLQGYLDTLGLPYAGAGACGSAVAMDKILTKQIIQAHNIPQVDWLGLEKYEYEEDPDHHLKEIQSRLSYPLFVKPANLGSSVGINKVKDLDSLKTGIHEAFAYDWRVVIEEGKDVREIEFALLGSPENLRVSPPGEIIVHSEFYSYEAKYEDAEAYELSIPAKLSAAQMKAGQEMATRAFRALNIDGFARADLFFVSAEDKFYFNELNTIPGCTPISMFPRLWKETGLEGMELVDELIRLGMERHERVESLQYKFTEK